MVFRKEIFKPFIGYEEYYKISNYGNIYSIRSNKNLKAVKNGAERLILTLSVEGVIKSIQISVEVMRHFSNEKPKKYVDYKDGNPLNLNIDNLYYTDMPYNRLKSISVMVIDNITKIKYDSISELARYLNQNKQNVYDRIMAGHKDYLRYEIINQPRKLNK